MITRTVSAVGRIAVWPLAQIIRMKGPDIEEMKRTYPRFFPEDDERLE